MKFYALTVHHSLPFYYFIYICVLLCLFGTSKVSSLICYSCTATLSANIEEPAQQALRLFLDSAYRLPPANNLCNLEADIEFRTIPTAQCEIRDECVKVSAGSQGVDFVIRGCKSHIFKNSVEVQMVLPCTPSQSPSLCFCKENLCNSAVKIQLNYLYKILFLAGFFKFAYVKTF